MTEQALYRKWRPRTFEEVVGQEHVINTLRNALSSGRIHHAYLFAGPRGTGKTTTARLLAKAVNCLAPETERPCNKCSICQAVNEGRLLDLIEIDAASNTGVDDVRELRERVGFRPNEARYKVYVIDEVHMLSTSAFNALLKTLEEPPPHAIFVLATTEAHKIPPTVISRCQRFNFRRLSLDAVVARLEHIVEQEKIQAEREALVAIARQATGSMRDAESLLDQLASYTAGNLTAAEVRAVLGIGSSEAVFQVADALIRGDAAQGLSVINTAVEEGVDPRQFACQIVDHLRALILVQLRSGIIPPYVEDEMLPRLEEQAAASSTNLLVRAVKLFNRAAMDAKGSWQPQLPLEMAFVEALLPPDAGVDADSQPPTVQRIRAGVPASSRQTPPPSPPEPNTATREAGADYRAASVSAAKLQECWPEFLSALHSRNLSLEALMRSCRPVAVEGDVVVLGFDYDFHRGKVEEERNKRDVEDTLSSLLGWKCRVRCVLRQKGQQEQAGAAQQRPQPASGEPLSPPPDEQTLTDDPLIRTAIEDLGAQIIG
jgi:DNA polymerase-3 subunit gamma/tau